MKKFMTILTCLLFLVPAISLRAATATRNFEGDCPDGVTKWKVVINYDTESGKITSTENTTCEGITRVTTYNYSLIVQVQYTVSTTSVSFNYNLTQFMVGNTSNIKIMNAITGSEDYAFGTTIQASTWTDLPTLINGLYVLVAMDPSTNVVKGAAVYSY